MRVLAPDFYNQLPVLFLRMSRSYYLLKQGFNVFAGHYTPDIRFGSLPLSSSQTVDAFHATRAFCHVFLHMHLLAFSLAPHLATRSNAFGSGPKLKSRLLKISDEDKSKALAHFSKPQTSL
jgi:hypothetical protein